MRMVWDPLIRIFHGSLMFFFLLAYLLEDKPMSLHAYAGYTVGLLLLFRLVWGLIGSEHARFSNFLVSPTTSIKYLKRLYEGTSPRHLGHNPTGALMIVVLLLCLAICVATGMSLFAMEGGGPLTGSVVTRWPAGLLVELHEFFVNLSLVLIAIHVIGVLATSKQHSENLTAAMITGKKRQSDESQA